MKSLRMFGSTTLEFCYIAKGSADVFILSAASPWDITAGGVIVEEAGGKLFRYDGSPWCWKED